MKKFLIMITPFCMVMFVLMWFSWGLKEALAFFGIVLFTGTLVFGFFKWGEFVDKHVKD